MKERKRGCFYETPCRPCWNVLISWLWSTVSFAWEWVLYTDRSHVLVFTLEWSEIMGSYNTLDTVVRYRRDKTGSWKKLNELLQLWCQALELASLATQAVQYKDWWWKLQLGKCYYRSASSGFYYTALLLQVANLPVSYTHLTLPTNREV